MYLLCSLSVSVFAQNDKQKITGIVYNENKEPLPGVVVRINSTVQTTTGSNGKYVLSGKWNADEKIEFAYIGYRTRSFTAGNRKILNVTMKESLIELDGCVVTAKTNVNPKSVIRNLACLFF
ncbi:CarboxypepD_reg-like domain-containing protein [Bacteroidales bacterium KHT7]|nr:CarboxypepD_reg-like domain-containing protein [Bacteroidales bacterium KHT7]